MGTIKNLISSKKGIFLLILATVSFLVLVVGIYGFFTNIYPEQRYEIVHLQDTNSSISLELSLEANHKYKVWYQLEDKTSTARVSGICRIYLNEELVVEEDLTYQNLHEETDAISNCIWEKEVMETSQLEIFGTMTDGQRWELIIYRDLPKNVGTRKAIFTYIMIGGILALSAVGTAIKKLKKEEN
jgi:hypothetical protein